MRGVRSVPRKVMLVEINVYENMAPLVSGYLQAYATADSSIRSEYRFEKYTTTRSTPVSQITSHLLSRHADVYAFSCYLWNIALVRTLVSTLTKVNPDVHILLGGPQVMHHAADYEYLANENIVVCNGEGEKTFAAYLGALTNSKPDLASVRGISYFADGELVTTESESRMMDLDDIPSPYLTGIFDDQYDMGVIETNRGCPFHCGFCFWGAATNDRVFKFSEDRVREDIAWISSHNIPFLYLADANWGMLKRDVEIAHHIADCKRKFDLPMFVYFSAAKNSPQRVTEITEIFSAVDLLSAQPISMQSLSESTLEAVDRKNIKLSAYETLQAKLNDKSLSSFIELIWPLPGETLKSFKAGMDELCQSDASHIVTYPHLLLHNTPIYEHRDDLQLVSRTIDDGIAEAEIVVQTADASGEEFEEGMWFIYGILALYNTRALRLLSAYLHKSGIVSYSELYAGFMNAIRDEGSSPFAMYCASSIETADYYDILNYPTVYHIAGHSERDSVDDSLLRFVSDQSWWDLEETQTLFAIDMLSKPHVYSNTPLSHSDLKLGGVEVKDVSDRTYTFSLDTRFLPLIAQESVDLACGDPDLGTITIALDHARGQRPFHTRQSREHNANYCNGIMMRVNSVMPTWSRCELV